MSADVEDSESVDVEHPTATMDHTIGPQTGGARHSAGNPDDPAGGVRAAEPSASHENPHHHILIEPAEDRWAWRRRIRQRPRTLAVYRVGVGIAGLLLIGLGFVSGPLPGPGGIPLVLLGLAIWSSEFEWAHRVMVWFKEQLRRFRALSTPRQALVWVAFFAACGCVGYLYLVGIGLPGWLPQDVSTLLQRLPGVGG